MNEVEWLSCMDPRLMLDHIRHSLSARKLRWFACACARSVWPYLLDERSQFAIEMAELFADGHIGATELEQVEEQAWEVARIADLRSTVTDPGWAATRVAARAATLDAFSAASGTAFISALCAAPWKFGEGGAVVHNGDPTAKAAARRRLCELLREIVGNPFRPAVIAPDWLRWNNEAVLRLAQEIYECQRFEEVPILGDALEEAGCEDAVILGHCRSGPGHIRGCWLLDLCLGRS